MPAKDRWKNQNHERATSQKEDVFRKKGVFNCVNYYKEEKKGRKLVSGFGSYVSKVIITFKRTVIKATMHKKLYNAQL